MKRLHQPGEDSRGNQKKPKRGEWAVPTISIDQETGLSLADMVAEYEKSHLLLLRSVKRDVSFSLNDVYNLFQASPAKAAKTWQREVSHPIDKNEPLPDPKAILVDQSGGNFWYFSFIIDLCETKDESCLPLPLLPVSSSSANSAVRYSNEVWVFVGVNETSSLYNGRVLHTDDIPHHVLSFPFDFFL
jgi:hypothetical protein